jgi:hypothetical protein
MLYKKIWRNKNNNLYVLNTCKLKKNYKYFFVFYNLSNHNYILYYIIVFISLFYYTVHGDLKYIFFYINQYSQYNNLK